MGISIIIFRNAPFLLPMQKNASLQQETCIYVRIPIDFKLICQASHFTYSEAL